MNDDIIYGETMGLLTERLLMVTLLTVDDGITD